MKAKILDIADWVALISFGLGLMEFFSEVFLSGTFFDPWWISLCLMGVGIAQYSICRLIPSLFNRTTN